MRSRRRQRISLLSVTALVLSGLTAGLASTHPDHGGGREDFPGEGVADGMYKQHDGDEGHLPPVNRNVTLVGKGEVTNPSGAGNTGRVASPPPAPSIAATNVACSASSASAGCGHRCSATASSCGFARSNSSPSGSGRPVLR